MLGATRIGAAHAGLGAVLDHLRAAFAGAGAEAIEVPHLYIAEALLDLYGEDLRARAFLFPDPERANELCLRPDFTVPVVEAHGARGWDRAARYHYHGPVFRRQPPGQSRPVEYLQSGFEAIGEADAVAADVAVFTVLHRALADLGVPGPAVTVGDLSILIDLLGALDMPGDRRAGLRRHLWRPARFQALLERASVRRTLHPDVARLAALAPGARLAALADGTEAVGLRGADEVAARIVHLAAEADAPTMPAADRALINAVMSVRGPAPEALARLRAITAGRCPALAPTLDRFGARLEALAGAGMDVDAMHFDAAFGRNLEYYDGFVFEMRAAGRGGHPPLAGGGRYDSMTPELGAPARVPAVGGIIRPEAVVAVRS